MSSPTRVVVVRPWADADASTSCCGGRVRDAVFLDDDAGHRHRTGGAGVATPVAELYRRLRDVVPTVDVQIVSSTNAVYLVPWAFRAARRRGTGLREAVRDALGATRGGAVLVDGAVIGDVDADDSGRLAEQVRDRCRRHAVALVR